MDDIPVEGRIGMSDPLIADPAPGSGDGAVLIVLLGCRGDDRVEPHLPALHKVAIRFLAVRAGLLARLFSADILMVDMLHDDDMFRDDLAFRAGPGANELLFAATNAAGRIVRVVILPESLDRIGHPKSALALRLLRRIIAVILLHERDVEIGIILIVGALFRVLTETPPSRQAGRCRGDTNVIPCARDPR